MPELVLNHELAKILTNHGIHVTTDEEFVYADLPAIIKLKARAVYQEINSYISSQLDVTVITENGEKIIESFGDFGPDFETTIQNNLTNFDRGSLHPILSAFGSDNPKIVDRIDVEEWEVNGKQWLAYLGNLTPKTNSKDPNIRPPAQFFNAIETSIQSQNLKNDLHWFRGFYLQSKDRIVATEFLMDNEDITASNVLFSSIPVIPDTDYYSCRCFVMLRRKTH